MDALTFHVMSYLNFGEVQASRPRERLDSEVAPPSASYLIGQSVTRWFFSRVCGRKLCPLLSRRRCGPPSRDQRACEILSPGADEAGHVGWMPFGHHFAEVLHYRTLARLAQQHSSVSFGVLVDDWSIHWRTSNPHGRGFRKVVDALDDTFESLTQLGSFPSFSKSGAVCSHARFEGRLRPCLPPFKMKVKRHMRDMFHELSGPFAR